VAETLKANGIALQTISHLILGHAHFDHIGNVADFPDSLPILVGPGSPIGEELATEIDVPIDVIKNRNVRELSHEKDKWQMVGTFQGYDYFGDGSFWLLDVPGVSFPPE
jgi:glyoxylase-like metal-dependent hydrolase (beta-lactamase superfamily II)